MTEYLNLPDATELSGVSGSALGALLDECVTASWHQGCRYYPDVPCPPHWLDLKGKSAGQAHFKRGGLRFNATLLRENPWRFLHEVVPHEMAHWFVFHALENDGRRRAPHGAAWQAMMRDVFMRTPSVTHSFDVTQASPRPYRFRCACSTHHLSHRRYLNTLKGTRYRCRACGKPLHYQGPNDPVAATKV
ncbi:SprT-like domain-containing protein [Larsenimonas salina]|uniref:SprT family zinc-dependent metalloprotease n=1 Tax=Larsenimonas salina TaxID=1295565 RepID=UPI0020739760|nr:SprT-like domain-containing protein [Larsenimonas salina]MCM5703949.1 SprT-like domain-containing protein [Larsenimonas salina]